SKKSGFHESGKDDQLTTSITKKMLPYDRHASRLKGIDENGGVDARIVQADVPVQMRSRGPAGGADFAYYLPSLKLLASLDLELGQVAIHGDETLSVINEDGLAIEKIVSHDGHHPVGGRLDRRTRGNSEVQS